MDYRRSSSRLRRTESAVINPASEEAKPARPSTRPRYRRNPSGFTSSRWFRITGIVILSALVIYGAVSLATRAGKSGTAAKKPVDATVTATTKAAPAATVASLYLANPVAEEEQSEVLTYLRDRFEPVQEKQGGVLSFPVEKDLALYRSVDYEIPLKDAIDSGMDRQEPVRLAFYQLANGDIHYLVYRYSPNLDAGEALQTVDEGIAAKN